MEPGTSQPCPRDRPLTVLLAALFLTRLSMVIAYPALAQLMPQWVWANNDGYDAIALNWVNTGVFALDAGIPTAARLPLYPGLIAACVLSFGEHYALGVMLIQVLLSTATGLLLFRMTHSIFGRRPALVTLVLFILHPQVNNFIFRCATETLFTFIVTALVYAVVRYQQGGRDRDLLGAAIWLALSLLTRQTLLPLALLSGGLLALWSLRRVPLRRVLRNAGIASATVLLILAPWLTRNYMQSGAAPVLQTWVGEPLFQGTYVSRQLPRFLAKETTPAALDQEALAILRGRFADEHDAAPTAQRPIAGELQADALARHLAYAALLDDPFASARDVLRNIVLTPVLQMTWKSTIVLMLWNWPLLALILVGAVGSFRADRSALLRASPIALVFFYLLGVHAIVWPQARYILPGLVPMMAFAGVALARMLDRLWPSRREA